MGEKSALETESLASRHGGEARETRHGGRGREKQAGPAYWVYDHFPLPLPNRHRYPRNRFQIVRETLLAEGVLSGARLHPARPEDWDVLALVHDADYLANLREGRLSARAVREIGIPFSPQLVERARAAVFATRQAAHGALDHGIACVIGGGTHHAFAGRGAGYCLFNDIAVAIRDLQSRNLQSRHRIHRAAIVDLDVHQGNGSAALFRHDPGVFTFSLHGEKNWPHRKEAGDFDLGLPDGTGDDEYLAALEPPLVEMLERFRPELVFYLAGADPLDKDRLGRLALTHEGLRLRDALVLGLCHEGMIPVVVTLGGGYGQPMVDTIKVHVNTVREVERLWGNALP
ncbi:MAG: histone deacetylase [bacterium]